MKVVYFFGFSKFFKLERNKNTSTAIQKCQEVSTVKNTTFYLDPVEVICSCNENISCVTWSIIFRLSEETGHLRIDGYWGDRIITVPESTQLSIDNISHLDASWQKLILITETGKCYMSEDEDFKRFIRVPNEEKIRFKFCAVGDLFTVLLDEDGGVYTLESHNGKDVDASQNTPAPRLLPGILGIKIDSVCCGKEHVLLLSKGLGHTFSFGLGSRGQLGHGSINSETTAKRVEALTGILITQISAGGWHSLALSDIGDVYSWGWNNHGQLGITCVAPEVSHTFYVLPYLVEFPTECVVDQVACGSMHTVALATTPRCVWTWGWGEYGQLGHGDSSDITTPRKVEYFSKVHGEVVAIKCGPWQTVVTLERK